MPRVIDDIAASLDPARPVLLAGPTASGKSALAEKIVSEQGGVIVNADALQVWDCWQVLTARPSDAEMRALPHRLYGHVPRGTAYSVGHWLREMAPLLAPGAPRPVIVGGTGLFFTALTQGLADIPVPGAEIRAEADARLAQAGLAAMVGDLDPASRARIDTRNPARVQRAWEVLRATGRGIAAWQDDTGPPLLPLDAAQPLVMEAPPDWLTPRIARRFGLMLEAGALEEARALLPRWDPAAPWARAIGAPQLIAHLRGETDLETATEAAIVATRQYAKRQRTWFRARMAEWRQIPPG